MNFKLHYWPILTGGWIVLTFLVTYLISVLLKDVYPLFPFISETGAKPPASCVFGQMMNVAAVFTGITLYIRYRQVKFAIKSGHTSLPRLRLINTIAFWLGNIVAVGISIVGNFQGDVDGPAVVLTIHLIGALMAFGVGALYMLVQTKITFALKDIYRKYPQYGIGSAIIYLRILLLVLYYIFFFSTFICAAFSIKRFTGDQSTWWTSEDGGYALHLTAAFSEWFMVFVFLLYMLTVTKEFKSLEHEKIRFTTKYTDLTNNNQEAEN